MASSRMVVDSSIFIEFLRTPDKKKTTLYQLPDDSAIVILSKLTPYTIIERSFKGTGFDYWLGTGEYDENLLPFQK